MTHPDPVVPTPMTRPQLPTITASALLETRLLVQAVTAWLTRG